MKEEQLTLRTLMAITLSDVDIKLLQENDQETDKQEMFTVSQVRGQLLQTGINMINILDKLGIDLDEIIPVTTIQLRTQINGNRTN